ncbi:MAG: flagellar protein FlaG [Xanthomonadaceae bacterium]|jgi:flagellar protein FlaG|nr:flagellar protein FlaG [Xanthomonadaceae bacterium]
MSTSIPNLTAMPVRAPMPAQPPTLRVVSAEPAEGTPRASEPATPQAAPPPQPATDPRERASRVAAELARLAPPTSSLRFRVDPESDQVVVSVVDASTGDVLRQIPSEEALAIAKSLAETGTGIVSDKA